MMDLLQSITLYYCVLIFVIVDRLFFFFRTHSAEDMDVNIDLTDKISLKVGSDI